MYGTAPKISLVLCLVSVPPRVDNDNGKLLRRREWSLAHALAAMHVLISAHFPKSEQHCKTSTTGGANKNC